ncbi:MAG: hypothetical protein WCA49_05675 [Candidatus Sulfotelmatobacter sp.]
MKTIYYAHALCVYGTPCERAELKAIRGKFKKYRIINPSRYGNDPEKLRDRIGFCLRLVEKCDIVVFSCLLGKVTAGVGKEVNHALKIGTAVYELQPKSVVRRRQKVKHLSIKGSILQYRRWWHIRGGNPW